MFSITFAAHLPGYQWAAIRRATEQENAFSGHRLCHRSVPICPNPSCTFPTSTITINPVATKVNPTCPLMVSWRPRLCFVVPSFPYCSLGCGFGNCICQGACLHSRERASKTLTKLGKAHFPVETDNRNRSHAQRLRRRFVRFIAFCYFLARQQASRTKQ